MRNYLLSAKGTKITKFFTFLIGLLMIGGVSLGQTTIWLEDFSSGTYSVTAGGEGSDGTADYFMTTDGADINVTYTGFTGNFFAAQDVDDGGWTGSANPSQLTWSSIDVSGYTNLEIKGLFANVNTDKIDASDYVIIEYNLDSGGWTTILQFENDGSTYNTGFLEDTDFDGTGDGTALSSTATSFSNSIGSTGSSIDIRITVSVNAGDEDFAFDDIKIIGSAAGPTISLSSLTDFGDVCTGTTAGPNSFTITGTNLTTDNVTVAALTGYTYSTTSGGTYTSSLNLTQGGGAYSQDIYVKFDPSLVQSYDGNIVVDGGGISSPENCAATGSGVNSGPGIDTPTSTSITTTTAVLGGNITDLGCSNITEIGIEWSTTDGFTEGTGTEVSETSGAPYSTGAFTVNVSGLSASTVYYFKAYAENSGGRVYTTQGTFTTTCATASIPYSQGFENGGSIPTCWSDETVTDSDADAEVTYVTTSTGPSLSTADEGTYFVKFNSYNCDSGDEVRLISTPISTVGESDIELSFALYQDDGYSSYANEGVTTQWSTDGTTWNNLTFYNRYSATNGWTDQSDILPAEAENQSNVYIGFLFHSEYGNNVYIDDVVVDLADPEITVSTSTLSGFIYVEGAGPSAEQTFTVEGDFLTADIVLTAPTNYEISETSGSGFTNSITLTQSGGSVSTTTIYVRLKAGLSEATYNNEDISATSTGATSQTVTCNGEVASSSTPVTIVYQGFEVDPATPADTWNYTPSGTVTESTDRSYVGSQSGRIDAAGSVTLDNTDISSYENVVLSVAYSFSGVDSGDDLYLDISYDNGSTWTGTGSVQLVDGYSNANYAFGTTNASNPTTVATNPWTVDIDDTETQISVRLRSVGCSTGEYYYIDDIKLSGTVATTDPEPTNHATAFACGTTSYNSISFTWTDAVAGAQAPDYYLILCNTTGTFTDPVDGTPQADSEGSIANIAHGTQTVTFTGLTESTTYYFKVFPYTNTGANVDYKTDGTPLTGNCNTNDLPELFISELAGTGYDADYDNEYIELTNNESYSISLDGWQLLYYEEGSLEETVTFGASDIIGANDAFVVAARSGNTITEDYLASFSINNANSYVILKDDEGAIYDQAGSSGDPFDNDFNYEFTQCDDDNYPVANWDNNAENNGTPGVVNCISCVTPTTEASSLNFSSITASEMTLDWTNGDGAKRIVIAREGAAVSFTPTDLNTYEATNVFSDGTDLGSGNICVYNGNGSTVTVSGLDGSTTYYFAIYEYNCLPGSELYYGTSLTGNETTTLSAITNLQVTCQTNSTAEITWDSPTGDYTGVIIGVRNDVLVPHTVSGDASTYTADAIFGSGYEYGTTTPKSYVVYNGNGNSVTVTGLTAGQSYSIKAYTYKNNTSSIWADSKPTTSISSLGVSEVSNQIALADNAQVQLQWTSPNSACYDEVLIVANAGSAITTQPTGDGSSYTGNLAYGSGTSYGTGYVVYKGDFSPQIVTGLTNDVEYCFTWFVRSGSSWSQGVSDCATPEEITVLLPGDLAIVAVNTQATSSGSDDEICFFAFIDIAPGTAIDFTDNGYERETPDDWADSEGTIRLTYNGASSIPAGQVICFQGAGYQSTDFDIFTCGTLDNANWTVTSLNGTGAYDLNVDDQIWIMQGGAWDYGTSLYDHDAYYSGNVLYGWTATSWKPDYGYGSTKGSTIFPGLECFNTDVTVNSNHDKVKYIGPLTTATQFEWISRINDNANWWGYADNTAYNSVVGYDYSGTCITFDINGLISIGSAGVWTGAYGEDWFDCSNWENLRIPNGSVDVVISGAVSNNVTIDDGISSVPEAECNSLTIASDATVGPFDAVVDVNHTDAVLNIYGNMSNDQVLELTDGEIHFMGNFTNNDTYTHTAGTAFFDGSDSQSLSGTAEFYNLTIENTSSGIIVNNDITINNILTLTDGLVNSGANTVIIDNNATTSVTGHSSASYIVGILRRSVAATGSYDLPVGSATNYQLANITLNTSTIDYLNAQFTDTHSGTTLPGSPSYITVDGDNIIELLDNGFWTISPVTGDASDYTVTLTSTGHTNGGADATDHTIVKRANSAGAWTSYDANHDDATQSGSGSSPITAVLTNLNGFSDFAIAKKEENLLPVELLFFDATAEKSIVNLDWQTATEINNDYFIIERSADGLYFSSIGTIKGAGNSLNQIDYKFIDKDPIIGTSYYRLKQVDYNGDFEYSQIENVLIESGKNLSVYSIIDPDYAASIVVNNPNKGSLTLNITDMSGKIIYQEKLDYQYEEFSVKIDKSKLRPGMYIFHVYNQHEIATQKVIIF